MYTLKSFLMVSAPMLADGGEDELSQDAATCPLREKDKFLDELDYITNSNPSTDIEVRSVGHSESSCMPHRTQWAHAYQMLQENPRLVTPTILNVTLKGQPPLDLVTFMLKLNPDAANVPKQGLSSLQVAVQHYCSIDIVTVLLKACPIAAVTSNPGSLDPLSYVKVHRSSDNELINLLSTPLDHWLQLRDKNGFWNDQPVALNHYGPKKPTTKSFAPLLDPTSFGPKIAKTMTIRTARASQTTSVDPVEVTNLKRICLVVLKKHKYLVNELKSVQKDLFGVSQSSSSDELATTVKDEILLEVKQKTDKLYRQQINRLETTNNTMWEHVRTSQNHFRNEMRSMHGDYKDDLNYRIAALTRKFEHNIQDVSMRIDRLEACLLNNKIPATSNETIRKLEYIQYVNNQSHPTTKTVVTKSDDDNEDDVSQMLFSSPWFPNYCDDNDDVRSLLSDDILLDRKRSWNPLCSGKRIFFILFQNKN